MPHISGNERPDQRSILEETTGSGPEMDHCSSPGMTAPNDHITNRHSQVEYHMNTSDVNGAEHERRESRSPPKKSVKRRKKSLQPCFRKEQLLSPEIHCLAHQDHPADCNESGSGYLSNAEQFSSAVYRPYHDPSRKSGISSKSDLLHQSDYASDTTVQTIVQEDTEPVNEIRNSSGSERVFARRFTSPPKLEMSREPRERESASLSSSVTASDFDADSETDLVIPDKDQKHTKFPPNLKNSRHREFSNDDESEESEAHKLSAEAEEKEFRWKMHRKTQPNAKFRKGALLAEERKILDSAVDEYMKSHNLDLSKFGSLVHSFGQARTAKRIRFWSHFIYCLLDRQPKNMREYMMRNYQPPSTKQGKFSEHERRALLKYVQIHGKDWKKIGSLMRRYREDVKNIYTRMKVVQDSNKATPINSGPWSQQEEKKFRQALATFTQEIDFAKVSAIVGSRTKFQCSDHERARHRTDGTYAAKASRQNDIKKSTNNEIRVIERKSTRLSSSLSGNTFHESEKSTRETITEEHFLRFVLYLIETEATDLDNLPSTLGDFETLYGRTALKKHLHSERAKIKKWRSMSASETLQTLKRILEEKLLTSA